MGVLFCREGNEAKRIRDWGGIIRLLLEFVYKRFVLIVHTLVGISWRGRRVYID